MTGLKTKFAIVLAGAFLVVGAGLLIRFTLTNPKASVRADTAAYATTSVNIGQKNFKVELAVTADQQSLGLGQRNSLPATAGMLFVFKPAESATFWMKDMRFPIDMIWIYQGKIIAINRNVPVPLVGTKPADLPTYSPKEPVDYVLEVNAGASSGVNIGDQFELVDTQGV